MRVIETAPETTPGYIGAFPLPGTLYQLKKVDNPFFGPWTVGPFAELDVVDLNGSLKIPYADKDAYVTIASTICGAMKANGAEIIAHFLPDCSGQSLICNIFIERDEVKMVMGVRLLVHAPT